MIRTQPDFDLLPVVHSVTIGEKGKQAPFGWNILSIVAGMESMMEGFDVLFSLDKIRLPMEHTNEIHN